MCGIELNSRFGVELWDHEGPAVVSDWVSKCRPPARPTVHLPSTPCKEPAAIQGGLQWPAYIGSPPSPCKEPAASQGGWQWPPYIGSPPSPCEEPAASHGCCAQGCAQGRVQGYVQGYVLRLCPRLCPRLHPMAVSKAMCHIDTNMSCNDKQYHVMQYNVMQ